LKKDLKIFYRIKKEKNRIQVKIMSEIINYYNQFDEWGRLEREPIEFQVNWHYIKK